MLEQCYFCGSLDKIEKHHIIPDRYGGPDTEDNLVSLCHECHRKIESLYDSEFWKMIGAEIETDAYSKFKGKTTESITIHKLPNYGSDKNFRVKQTEDCITAECKDCEIDSRIKEVGIPDNQDNIFLRFKCVECGDYDDKKIPHNPKSVEGEEIVAELTDDITFQELKKNQEVKKSLELEEWYKLANDIKDLRDILMGVLTSGLPKNSVSEFDFILKKLDEARDDLEKRFFNEYPDAADIKTFYGEDRKRVDC